MNPCELCEAKNKKSGCDNCALYNNGDTCSRSECFVNFEGSCLLGIASVCKASPEYEDDLWKHDCSECVHIKDCDGEFSCELTGDEVCSGDSACEDFEEAMDD